MSVSSTDVPQLADAAHEAAEAAAAGNGNARLIPRLRDISGIPVDRLAPLHGQLIAHGLLRFNLLSRTAGVGYRVTPEGREALSRVSVGHAPA